MRQAFNWVDYFIVHFVFYWRKVIDSPETANGSGRIVGLIILWDNYCTRAAQHRLQRSMLDVTVLAYMANLGCCDNDCCRGLGASFDLLDDDVEQLEFWRTGGGGSFLFALILIIICWSVLRWGLLLGVLMLSSSSSSELLSIFKSVPAWTSFMSEIIFIELWESVATILLKSSSTRKDWNRGMGGLFSWIWEYLLSK